MRDVWCQMHFQGDDHMWFVPVVYPMLSALSDGGTGEVKFR